MMNSIFRELLYEEILANYMDNFIILAKTMKKLEERTIRFLKIIEKHNLCFKRSKCDLNMEEIPILRVVVGKDQLTILLLCPTRRSRRRHYILARQLKY